MKWAKIGFESTKNQHQTYKKYEPPKQKSISREKKTHSMSRSKSFQKIKLSIEARDSSKLHSLNRMDLSDNIRPSTPLSKSTTSMRFFPQPLYSSRQCESPIIRMYNKFMLYIKELKDELIDLKIQFDQSMKEFFSFKIKLQQQITKMFESLNRQIKQKGEEIRKSLTKINQLQQQNYNLSRMIGISCIKSQQNNEKNRFSSPSNALDKEVFEQNFNKVQNNWSNASDLLNLRGMQQIQNTLNKLKVVFIDHAQV